MYRLKNRDTGEIFEWTLDEILIEINRDRSEDWSDYNESDWEEGLDQFTEYELIGVIK